MGIKKTIRRVLHAVKPAASDFDHRAEVGGLWDELGTLQLRYLQDHGLQPQHRLLDLGCGCLRGGIHFVRYLEPKHYYGIDNDPRMIAAAKKIELPAAGLERSQLTLACRDDFNANKFGVSFDFVLAQSLLTHLPLSDISQCFHQVRRCLHPKGKFFASIFQVTAEQYAQPQVHHVAHEIISYPDEDPYHYTLEQLSKVAQQHQLCIVSCTEWGHPRSQKMLLLRHATT